MLVFEVVKVVNQDELYMHRCLHLAGMGRGMTAPNPMVGCVAVRNGRIIGEGFHRQYGGDHAEVNALRNIPPDTDLSGATLYVNLEPCVHYGKTPPCAEAILTRRIGRIVVGMRDPNPLVAGEGIRVLRQAGAEVVTGVMETECRWLNRRFITFHVRQRPYIILKWAQTADGFLDATRTPGVTARPTWITGAEERDTVHRWRSEENAVMVGARTVEADDPALNLRYFTGRQPLRIVLDRRLELSGSFRVFDGASPTLVLTEKADCPAGNGIRYGVLTSLDDLAEVLHALYEREVQSVFVEGGARLLNSFLHAGLWDEARIFTGRQYFRQGVPAPPVPPGTRLPERHFSTSTLQIITAQDHSRTRPTDDTGADV